MRAATSAALPLLLHLLPLTAPGSLDGPGSLAGPGSLPGKQKGGSVESERQLDHLECRKCGADLFDFSRPAAREPAPPKPKPLGLLRPKGLLKPKGAKDAAAAPPPPPLVGGREIDLESATTTGPDDPEAAGYSGPHKEPSERTILGRKMQVHQCAPNPPPPWGHRRLRRPQQLHQLHMLLLRCLRSPIRRVCC